jgi:hypothetical protein
VKVFLDTFLIILVNIWVTRTRPVLLLRLLSRCTMEREAMGLLDGGAWARYYCVEFWVGA